MRDLRTGGRLRRRKHPEPSGADRAAAARSALGGSTRRERVPRVFESPIGPPPSATQIKRAKKNDKALRELMGAVDRPNVKREIERYGAGGAFQVDRLRREVRAGRAGERRDQLAQMGAPHATPTHRAERIIKLVDDLVFERGDQGKIAQELKRMSPEEQRWAQHLSVSRGRAAEEKAGAEDFEFAARAFNAPVRGLLAAEHGLSRLTRGAPGRTASALGIPKVATQTVQDVLEMTVGAPGGILTAVASPGRAAKAMKQDYSARYGPLFHGDVKGFYNANKNHPVFFALDLAAGAGMIAKGAELGGVMRSTSQIRKMGLGDESTGKVQLFRSPASSTAHAQDLLDRLSERHPELPVVGAQQRVAHALSRAQEDNLAELKQLAVGHMAAARKLSRPEKIAYDIIRRYGSEAPSFVRLEINKRDHLARSRIGTRKERVLQARQVRQLRAALQHVDDPSDKLVSALAQGKALSQLTEEMKFALGTLNPDTAAERLDLSARIFGDVEPVEDVASRTRFAELAEQHLPEAQARAVVAMTDWMAQAWSAHTGRPASEFYDQAFSAEQARIGIGEQGAARGTDLSPATLFQKLHTRPRGLVNGARRLARRFPDAIPERAGTPTKLADLLEELRTRAIDAELYKTWYTDSANEILAHAGGNVDAAIKMAKLLAIYSPRAAVWDATEWNNVTRALGAFEDFTRTGQVSDRWSFSKAGKSAQQAAEYAISRGEKPPAHRDWQTEAAQRVMTGQGDWEGLKTNRFYRNFLEDIAPERYAAEFGAEEPAVTIDTWMRRAFGYDTTRGEVITPAQYRFMSEATSIIADELGWAPKEAQAAIWTSIKAEREHIPLEAAGVSFRDALREYRSRREVEQPSLFDVNKDAELARAHEAVAEIRENGGFTRMADLTPDPEQAWKVAWGAYERTMPAGDESAQNIVRYRDMNQAAIDRLPEARIGGWESEGKLYLDVVRSIQDDAEAMAFAREQGQLAMFHTGTFEERSTGLTEAEADAIKARLKAEDQNRPRSRANPESEYDRMIEKAARDAGARGRQIGSAQRREAERVLTEWAENHPGDPMADRFLELQDRAHEARQSPDPELLFQREPGNPQMLDAATVEIAFTPDADIAAVATKYGLDPVELADYARANSERLTGRILSNEEVWLQGIEDYDAARDGELIQGYHGGQVRGTEVYLTPSRDYASAFVTGDEAVKFMEFNAKKVLRHKTQEEWMATGKKAVEHFGGPEAAGERFGHDPQRMIAAYARDQGYDAIVNEPGTMLNYNLGGEFVTEAIALNPDSVRLLYQRDQEGIKGAVEFSQGPGAIHAELGRADISTFVHEPAHILRRFMPDEQLAEIERALGIGDGVWTRTAEEEFARLVEAYFWRGQEPSPQTRRAFGALSRGLREVYRGSPAPRRFRTGERELVYETLDELFDPTLQLKAGDGAFFAPDLATWKGRGTTSRKRSLKESQQKVHRSRGILYEQGRVIRGPDVVTREFFKTAREYNHKLTLDQLDDFSIPRDPDAYPETGGVPPGYVLYNPKGHEIPRIYKETPTEDDILGMFPLEAARKSAQQYDELMQSYFPDRFENVPDDLHDEVRAIPEKIARQFENRGVVMKASQIPAVAKILQFIDTSNSIVKAGVVFGKFSYVPVNLAGNGLFLAIKAGPWAAPAIVRASKFLGGLDPELLAKIDYLTGEGSIESLATEASSASRVQTAVHTLAHYQSAVADRLPRRAAWVYSAARKGFTSEAEVRKLAEGSKEIWKDNITYAEMRRQVSMDARNAMVEFGGMGDFQKQVLSRAIFIYGWIRGATKYTGRLALDAPVRADLIGNLGEDEYKRVEKKLGKLVDYMQGLHPVGEARDLMGFEKVVPVRNLMALNPVSTGGEVLMSLYKLASGDIKGGFQPSDYFSPALKIPVEFLTGYNLFFGEPYDNRWEAVYGQVPRYPVIKITRDLIDPQTTDDAAALRPVSRQPNYIRPSKEEARWEDLEELFLGSVRKRYLNTPAAQARGREQRGEKMGLQDHVETLQSLGRQANMPKPPPVVMHELGIRTAISDAIDEDMTPVQRATVVAEAYAKKTGNDYPLKRLRAGGVSNALAEKLNRKLRHALYPHLLAYERVADKIIDNRVERDG